MTLDHPCIAPLMLIYQKDTNQVCSKGIPGLVPDAGLDRGPHGLTR
ncbi:hypothetical protein [Yoonia sp.]